MALSEAAIGAIGAGAAAAVTTAGSIGSAALNNRRAWNNWKRQHEYLLQDWYRQNAYNTPRAQMRRFEAAGLNPNLIYGQQNTANGIDTPAPPPAQEIPLDFGTAVNAAQQRYIQMRQLAIQQQNSDALVKMYAAKTDQAESSTALNNALTALRHLQHEGYKESGYYSAQGYLKQEQIKQTMAKINLLISNKTIADLQGEFLKKTLQNRINQVQAVLTGTRLRNDLLRQEKSLYSLRRGIMSNQYALGNVQIPFMNERLNQLREYGDFLFDSYPLKLEFLRNQNSMFPYMRSDYDSRFNLNSQKEWDLHQRNWQSWIDLMTEFFPFGVYKFSNYKKR